MRPRESARCRAIVEKIKPAVKSGNDAKHAASAGAHVNF